MSLNKLLLLFYQSYRPVRWGRRERGEGRRERGKGGEGGEGRRRGVENLLS